MLDITLPAYATDLILLAIRIVVAVAFVVSARNKFKNMNKFAKNHGLSIQVGYFLATAEIAGALGIATGVLGQLAALGLMLLMCSTMYLHIFKWKSPYWANRGGWEYDLMLFLLCAVLLSSGLGSYTLYAILSSP